MHNTDIPELDRKGLRRFGLTTGSIIAVLFGLFFPWFLERPIPRWPWLIAGTLSLWALLAPQSLKLVYRTWMRFGLLLNKLTTPLIMGLLYFLVIVPTGLLMRLFRRDPLNWRFKPNVDTYRLPSSQDTIQLDKPY